jgi:hypothetical protein
MTRRACIPLPHEHPFTQSKIFRVALLCAALQGEPKPSKKCRKSRLSRARRRMRSSRTHAQFVNADRNTAFEGLAAGFLLSRIQSSVFFANQRNSLEMQSLDSASLVIRGKATADSFTNANCEIPQASQGPSGHRATTFIFPQPPATQSSRWVQQRLTGLARKSEPRKTSPRLGVIVQVARGYVSSNQFVQLIVGPGTIAFEPGSRRNWQQPN